MLDSEIYHLETGDKHGSRVNCPSWTDLVGSANAATGEVDSDQEGTTYSYGFKRQQNLLS